MRLNQTYEVDCNMGLSKTTSDLDARSGLVVLGDENWDVSPLCLERRGAALMDSPSTPVAKGQWRIEEDEILCRLIYTTALCCCDESAGSLRVLPLRLPAALVKDALLPAGSCSSYLFPSSLSCGGLELVYLAYTALKRALPLHISFLLIRQTCSHLLLLRTSSRNVVSGSK
eukprot:scaffold135488_cov18-Tisochrysis_lutea.AAC.1